MVKHNIVDIVYTGSLYYLSDTVALWISDVDKVDSQLDIDLI